MSVISGWTAYSKYDNYTRAMRNNYQCCMGAVTLTKDGDQVWNVDKDKWLEQRCNFELATLDYKLCPFHPLIVTDKKFRDKVLAGYGPDKMLTALKNIITGVWKLPDPNLIKKDPILATMILNPWYIADDANNTVETIEYPPTLDSFVYQDKIYSNFIENGIFVDQYTNIKGEKFYYYYMDNDILIDLPSQLYIGKTSGVVSQETLIKIEGKIDKRVVTGIKISNLEEFNREITARFYKFLDIKSYTQSKANKCKNVNPSDQQKADPVCKFFPAEMSGTPPQSGLDGIIIALRRVVVVNIDDNIIDDYIESIDKKIRENHQLTYLEFFMWLSMKSKRDKITYKFKLKKKSK
jgi:hypothetical protein